MYLRIIIAGIMVAAAAATVRAQAPDPSAQAEDPRGRELDDLLAKGLRGVDPLTSAETQRAIELGLALGRPHGVEPVVKSYFANDSTPPSALLRLAADSARVRGDFRTAITRQKLYVQGLPVNIEASEGAARLYRLYMDMGLKEEAYVFMKANGEPLRGSVNAKKFDGWFLQMAWERGDLTTVARWLAACLGDQGPLELERLMYWGDLARLLDVTRTDTPRAYEAVPHMRRLVNMIRESPGMKAQLQFQTDSQLFCAGAAARDPEALVRDFAASAASAKAWFDLAPTAKTLAAICAMWSNGGDIGSWQKQWERAADLKRAFFKDAFGRLSDAEKTALFQQESLRLVIPSFLPPVTWLELVKQTPPSPARNSWAANVPLPWDSPDPAVHRGAVAALDGLNEGGASVIRALATGTDLNSGIQHLAKNESWCVARADMMETLVDDMVRISLKFPRGETNKLPRDAVEQSRARYAREVFFASPLAVLNPGANRTYMKLLWDTADRATAAQNFHLLDWVPLSPDERRLVYEDIEKRYREWSELVRKGKQEALRKAPETVAKFDAQIALIDPIGQALREVMDPAVYSADKAPSPLCKQMALLREATNRRDRDAALAAARAAYALLRDYEANKLPFGRMCLAEVLRSRAGSGSGVDISEINIEAFGDQLNLCVETGRSAGLDVALAMLVESRRWNQGGLYRAEGPERAKLEAVTSKAVLTMLGARKFDARIFDFYRQTRLDNPISREIMSKLIEGKVLVGQPDYTVTGDPRERGMSAAQKYQWLIEKEFAWMNEKYPRESYFDDMFAEEVARTRQIDVGFWNRSQDTQRKGANAACAVLKNYAKLPFGYDGSTPAYSPDEFWSICWNCMIRADEASRQALLAAAEAAFGKTRFDDYAVGCPALQIMGAPTSAVTRTEFFNRLGTTLERVRSLPRNVQMPDITAAITALNAAGNLSETEASLIQRLFVEMRPGPWAATLVGSAAELLHSSLLGRGRSAELLPAVPCLWAAARGVDMNQRGPNYTRLVSRATAAGDAGLLELAATYSVAGLTLGEQLSNEYRQTLEGIRSRALVALGGVIPVERSDRRYPIYAAQLAFMSGTEEDAWTKTVAARELITSEAKNLDPSYLLWIIGKATGRGNLALATSVARDAIDSLETTGSQMVDNETRARIYVAQADIAAAREDFPLAKSQYERIVLNKNYEGTRAKSLAELRVADVERRTRDYSGAILHLEALTKRDDVFVKAQAYYLLALVKYDQTEYKEAREYINQAMILDPGGADPRILEGKLNLGQKKLDEARRIRVGTVESQKVIVPGRSLSIQVEDRNLSVVGASAGIEVRVWTRSGDEEFMILRPFGDSKTAFEGEIATVLGVAVKGDRILQVLGGDQLFYDFSEKFKEVNKVSSEPSQPVTVMSDSELFASSGVILSREEMANIELERQLRSREDQPKEETETPKATLALSAQRALDQLKPGNTIRVRVVNPGQSVRPVTNSVRVRATTTSGDKVDFLVPETAVCSGTFDGELKTSLAPAAAYASDSNEGADPAFTISAGDNPPWVGLTDARRPKLLWVDLNDNVALKALTVQADVPARRLKRFAVQTSMSGSAFKTVGSWPDQTPPWNGSLQMRVMRFTIPEGFEKAKPGEQAAMINEAFELGGAPGAPPPVIQPGSLTLNLGAHVMGLAAKLAVEPDQKSPDSWYVMHVRGAFYLPKRAERAFRANVSGVAFNILSVDGRAAEMDKRTGAVSVGGSFGKGVHVLDFYLWAQRGSQVSYALENDIKEVPYFGTCPAEMFDANKNPQIPAALQFTPASVVAQPDNNGFDITFATNTQARVIRLALLDFEGDAPAIRRMKLTAADGRTVLPTKQDLLALRKNDVLETMPGDKIKIIYENPAPLTKERKVQECGLSATFNNASLNACFIEFKDDAHGERVPFYVGMRRFRMGDPINVFISDTDCDVSEKADTVKFTARSTSGAKVELEALEVEPIGGKGGVHSGVFAGKILTVAGQPQRPNELKLAEADDVEITYRDKENTDFGVPWDRTILVEQAGTDDPELRMFDVASSLLPPDLRAEEPASNAVQGAGAPAGGRWGDIAGEFVPGRRAISSMLRDSIDDTSSATGLLVCPVSVQITWPAMALSSLSSLRLHAQTGPTRLKLGVTNETVFDPNMLGTITYQTGPSGADGAGAGLAPGYKMAVARRSEAAQAGDVGGPLDQGLFTFSVPVQLGFPSMAPPSTPEERAKAAAAAAASRSISTDEGPTDTLMVRPNDDVFIGFEYKSLVVHSNAETGVVGPDTNTHWIVRRVKILADVQGFDVMDKKYKQPVHSIYMGDKVYLRVVDQTACTKMGEKNTCTVKVQAGSAAPITVTLNETRPDSSVFKGVLTVNAVEDVGTNMVADVLAARYGDTVKLTYTGGTGETIERSFSIATGSDGTVQSFTKKFKDQNIAVQTQFTVAEAYFELAKNHRQLKQEELSRREIAQGRKLLDEAIRDFPQNEARAQADYLLAELSLELASDTKDDVERRKLYAAALQRFIDICSTYPDSPYAPKSQFKKAVALEKMGLIDESCQEYVRLAYKYPDHELVAETIARLGKYFLDKGKVMENDMKSENDIVKKEKIRLQSLEMYKTAAQVLARLAKRFPDHSLASKTSVLSGQCWMRAEDYKRATTVLKSVIESKRATPELMAEAMYWCGDAYLKGEKTKAGSAVDAYRMWKRLTWDYPETQWAKYARGRLTEPVFAKIDNQGG